MKVILLAAGPNREFETFINEKPKCMLEIASETLILRQIRILNECGIENNSIYIVLGYHKESVIVPKDVNIIENTEYETKHNAYSLFLALKNIDDDVLILDADLIFESILIKNLLTQKSNILVASDNEKRYGSTGIICDNQGRVTNIGKHISTEYSYRGIAFITCKTVKKFLTELFKNSNMWYSVPLAKILSSEQFIIYKTDNMILEINCYADYLQAKRFFENENKLIMVTGASSFLGTKLYHILKRNHITIGTKFGSSSQNFYKVNLCNYDEVKSFIEVHNPQTIIHTAAMSDPDECAQKREEAWQLNVIAVKNLVDICKIYGIKLIHISTDYVFDGSEKYIYDKDAERKPVNYYGETKVKAENIVSKYANSLIIRIPILYGYNSENDKKTFPTQVLEKLKNNKTVEVDNQQIRFPVLIDDVANSIVDALEKKGIVHITSKIGVTKYQWAKIIAKEFGYQEKLITEKNGSINERPLHVELATQKDDYCVSDICTGTNILKCQMKCVFRLVYKSKPHTYIYNKSVAKYRFELGQKMAQNVPKSVIQQLDFIVPVPNSGMYYAMGIASVLKIPYLQALVKPEKNQRSFEIADSIEREQFIKEKIYSIPELINGKTIALVDEAIFTGITLRVVCDIIKACGVKKLYIIIPTPKSKKNCNKLVQPKRNILINEKSDSVDYLKNYFQVDGIYYQEECVFKNSICDIGGICYDCLSS